ncbi:MAG: hypothetical protein DMG57_06525 [Acidobacteria bacterium]|nr:MAG: hypothetical protein DMG57_06525 [Acidobacteriota bacterium]
MYSVEAEKEGFKKQRRTGLQLNIQQQLVADFTLTVGEVGVEIEVTAAAPILQTESGSVGQVVGSQTVNDLLLNGRNYTFLARLVPGATVGQPEGRGLNANGWFTANGTRPAQNNYMLDGIDNNTNDVDFLSGAAYVVKPPIDAIGEFKLQTNSFSAEFGRPGGAVLNATLKSGTNEIHGSAWEFLRNDKLDATDFFLNRAGQKKGAFKQNQFGATAGGPVIKNKTFWFVDYEGTRIIPANRLDAKAARQIDLSNYENAYDLALAYLQTGAIAKSREVISALLDRKDRAELHNLSGDVEEAEGHVQDAVKQYEIAARMDPTEKNLFDLGSHLLLHRGFEPALKVFAFATPRDPQSAKLRVGLGIAHYSLGQYDDAVETLCQAVDLDPKDTKALDFLGKMYDVST